VLMVVLLRISLVKIFATRIQQKMSTLLGLLIVCVAALSSARIVKPPKDSYLRQREMAADEYKRGYGDDDGSDEIDLKSLLARRGIFSCKEEGEACSGVPRCCGSAVCYWPEGYSIKTKGRCVNCVSAGQTCQRDSQCCSNLICHKDSTWATDGECGAKRPLGGDCHDSDQCQSEYCNIGWVSDVRGHGGRCETKPSRA
jgi:hypothetical protein